MRALSKTLEDLLETISDKEKVPSVLDNWESIRESYKFIKRPDGKELSLQDKEVLYLLSVLFNNKIQLLDYERLQERYYRSQRTIRRILDNLGNCFECKFYNLITIKGKKYYNKVFIAPTEYFLTLIDSNNQGGK